ncbi:LysR substrate-binding domain-containing protein [Roseateles depolymerans]|uniref:Transcriptional regulator, LysR family n=1 Tax=Roseateles depolymerans TaxID=76731 RepID=A0A0U3LNR3_9BURK|nr:LysR substrate-binding domain-containing protein [Roseateles depolymerans]ALV06567.1 Transcriptional regulator, LysR family [Roseateles depolymerans]REG19542.1 DNA-binding transcriptional LysR family regulator [Roseateles depolymerans]
MSQHDKRRALTPEALAMMDSIARSGSFAAAAREMGKVPSALTYSVRQLEDALDVLLFDRSSRQAVLTSAGQELLTEGRRLLLEIDAVANRVKRVATGWESELTIAVDDALARRALFDLMESFYQYTEDGHPPPTRLKLRTEVMAGTWEALMSGQADLAIGTSAQPPGSSVICEVLGPMEMVFCVAPHHPLAKVEGTLTSADLAPHRIVAVADTARSLAPMTLGVMPGQEVLTVPSMATKLEALVRGLGCGFLPTSMVRRHVEAGRLLVKQTFQGKRVSPMNYAWRNTGHPPAKALAWWLKQLHNETTRRALLEQHEGLLL